MKGWKIIKSNAHFYIVDVLFLPPLMAKPYDTFILYHRVFIVLS